MHVMFASVHPAPSLYFYAVLCLTWNLLCRFTALKILIDIPEKHCSIELSCYYRQNFNKIQNPYSQNCTVTCTLYSLAIRPVKAVVTQAPHTNESQNLYPHQPCLQLYILGRLILNQIRSWSSLEAGCIMKENVIWAESASSHQRAVYSRQKCPLNCSITASYPPLHIKGVLSGGCLWTRGPWAAFSVLSMDKTS